MNGTERMVKEMLEQRGFRVLRIDGCTVRAGALAVLAFSAVTISIGKFPSPGS